MKLDEQTLREIQEYEDYLKQQEIEFEENCRLSDEAFKSWIDRTEDEEWNELMKNADYYNDYDLIDDYK